ncbi:hypothetical protein C6P41_000898 [Kluyveromyces marxianus]|nr:hypothetical protein C6P43_001539 [Kluyveromyces marxianus]KAG0678874.1 hypothetical protein C6P41_000898 [Kluyveromyces marxianus]
MPSATRDVSFQVHSLDGIPLQLSTDPLDDYQRYLFQEVYELMKPSLSQFPHALQSQLSIEQKEYKTNTVFEPEQLVEDDGSIEKRRNSGDRLLMDYGLRRAKSPGQADKDTANSVHKKDFRRYSHNYAPVGSGHYVMKARPKKSVSLLCNEYTIPDISRNPMTQSTFDPNYQPYLQITPYNILALNEEQQQQQQQQPDENRLPRHEQSGGSVSPTDQDLEHVISMSNKPGSNVTKNQEFRMIKLKAKSNQSMIINRNNCVIWDRETGYVFFTGIWRLYQDVMKCLCTTNRMYQQDQSSRVHCCKEFQKVLGQVVYGKLGKPGKRETAGKWNKWSQKDMFASYNDLHWHKLDPALSSLLAESYNSAIPFEDMVKRIRGGYIKIQGTWLPFPVSKELCSRFCYPIRYLLVPVFGEDFPKKCEFWYMQRCEQSPSLSSSLSPVSNPSLTTSTLTTDEKDSLNTAQDLLNISRRYSWNEVKNPSIVQHIHLPNRHYRSQSWTGIVQSSNKPYYQQEERRKSSDVTLPPIQYLFDDLRKSYLDD